MEPDAVAAARSFGLDTTQSVKSLCNYGPVYRITDKTGDWVLKRTGFPHSCAEALARWLRFLKARNVSIVAPSDMFNPNPRQMTAQGEYWVVYPFVPGLQYAGFSRQIEAAGALLGHLHEQGCDYAGDLMCIADLPVHDAEWTAKHSERAIATVSECAPDILPAFRHTLDTRLQLLGDYASTRWTGGLDLAACSWDFKASNLVYRSADEPVLIDPDHGGRIPRIYDLACSLLLFHCDHGSSPGRLFSKREWETFLSGYRGVVNLSWREHSC